LWCVFPSCLFSGERGKYVSALYRAVDAKDFGNFLNSFALARSLLLSRGMKTFLVLVLSVTALYVWQRSGHSDAVTENKPTVEKVAVALATPRPVSEHNWAKHSLDRTHEVMDQVQQSREQNERP
jgi:hypothetical protein